MAPPPPLPRYPLLRPHFFVQRQSDAELRQRTRRLGPRPFLPSLDPYGRACARREPEPHHGGRRGVFVFDTMAKRASTASPVSIASTSAMAAQEIADAIAAQAQQLAYYHAYVGHRPRHSHPAAPRWSRPGAEGHEQGLLRPVGLGRQRDQDQARLVLQQPARPAGEEEDHLARARLSRLWVMSDR